jgi:hypothetical protein
MPAAPQSRQVPRASGIAEIGVEYPAIRPNAIVTRIKLEVEARNGSLVELAESWGMNARVKLVASTALRQ